MRTIQSKITLTYIFFSLAVVTLLGVLLSFEIERYFYDRLLSNLQTETDVIHSLLKEASVKKEAKEHTVANLSAISAAAHMRITLIDSTGKVIYESSLADSLLPTLENHLQRPEVVQARREKIGSNARLSKSIAHNLIYVARFVEPALFRNSSFPLLNYVRVAVELSELDQAIDEIRLKIIGAVLAVLATIIATSYIVSKRISRPLVEIGEIINDIKGGNLDRKLPVRSKDEIGRVAELINELTDKLKSDIEQLKKLERVRSEFLGNVSHELRTPIFSLKGFLETLLDGAINDQAVNRKFVEKAYNHASRLDILLSDLIEISRIESGEMKMSFRYFEAVAFLRQLAEDYTEAALRKHQQFILHLPEVEITVFGDKERLRQAIGNIIDNAIKYSQPEATIAVTLKVQDDLATISISDDGPGIEPEHLPRIFERFYRVDKPRSREVGGTGLGLAIVKHIIEAHGSKVAVHSEINKGTTFSFSLKR
ncbi:MAG: HAMP domain-containing protein [Ignavibacteriales bacterium]|nr:HAMP domain-containing protein [Ignavibacteriales bacterium]